MEYTEYRALYSINVNNYLAVKPDGKTKGKRTVCHLADQPKPDKQYQRKAAIAYLTKQIPVEDTILQCQDIRDFVTLRTVQGGAIKTAYYLVKQLDGITLPLP